MRPLVACLALLPATAPAPTVSFAPLLDRPYRMTIAETRSEAAGTSHYGLERRVVFHREGDGYLAEVTLVALHADPPGERARQFVRGTGALAHRTLRFHLGGDGTVRTIDDEDGVWSTLLAGVARMGETAPGVHGLGRTPAAPLAALPPERRHAIIVSFLAPVIGGPVPPLGTRAVTIASRSPFGAGSPLAGSETETRDADGTLRTVTHAGAPGLTLDRSAVLDPDHGLVLARDEVQTTTLGGATLVTHSRTEFTPVL